MCNDAKMCVNTASSALFHRLFHLPLEGDTVLTSEQTVKVELPSMFLKAPQDVAKIPVPGLMQISLRII